MAGIIFHWYKESYLLAVVRIIVINAFPFIRTSQYTASSVCLRIINENDSVKRSYCRVLNKFFLLEREVCVWKIFNVKKLPLKIDLPIKYTKAVATLILSAALAKQQSGYIQVICKMYIRE